MPLKYRVISLFVLYLLAAAASVIFILPVSGKTPPPTLSTLNPNPSTLTPRHISVLIVPHHLVAKDFIRRAFTEVAKIRADLDARPRRIILLGPNHFFRGHGQVITSTRTWQAGTGEMLPDENLISLLRTQNLASSEEGVVEGDHSITALLPFMEEFFPDARFVPLLMREPMSFAETEALGSFLARELTDDDLIIASIDFSHYLPKFTADFHDLATIAALHNLDSDFFKHNIDADSPQILMTLAEYLGRTEHETFTLLDHTNSATLTANPFEEMTTSHILGFFEKGPRHTLDRLTIIVGPHDEGNPLLYKGADFFIDTQKPFRDPVEFKKNNLSTTVSPDDLSETPMGIIIERSEEGRVTTTRCFFATKQCI